MNRFTYICSEARAYRGRNFKRLSNDEKATYIDEHINGSKKPRKPYVATKKKQEPFQLTLFPGEKMQKEKGESSFEVFVDGRKVGVLIDNKKNRKEIRRLSGLGGVELRRQLVAK